MDTFTSSRFNLFHTPKLTFRIACYEFWHPITHSNKGKARFPQGIPLWESPTIQKVDFFKPNLAESDALVPIIDPLTIILTPQKL
jgi:hypothetical protein